MMTKKYKIIYNNTEIELTQKENGKFAFPINLRGIDGSALKPAHEPIVMARKPFKGTLVNNVLTNGVGGINIDESRVGGDLMKAQASGSSSKAFSDMERNTTAGGIGEDKIGRFPANIIHDGSDEVIDSFPSTKKGGSITKDTYEIKNQVYGQGWGNAQLHQSYGDSGSAARFFYGSKCSKVDRNEGLDTNQINTGEFKGGKVLEEYRNQVFKNEDHFELREGTPDHIVEQIKRLLN